MPNHQYEDTHQTLQTTTSLYDHNEGNNNIVHTNNMVTQEPLDPQLSPGIKVKKIDLSLLKNKKSKKERKIEK